ncbi:MAG: lipocalin family protein [Bacteroidota bacterium]
MKKLLSGLGIVVMMALAMTSCADPDSTTLLTDGIWNFSNMTTDSEDENIKTFIILGKALMSEGTLEFQEGGDYIMTSPAMEELGDPDTGTWTLVGDHTLTMTNADGIPSVNSIDELSKDKLIYVETFVDQELGTHSVTMTWVR